MNTDPGVPRIRLVIVEDHPLIRDGLRTMLERQPDMLLVGETEFGDEAIQLVEEQAPDVVLLDLLLDNSPLSGLETLKRLTATSPSTHVLVLSAYSDDDLVFPALLNGAIGYMLKRGETDEVLDAVRGAAKGYYHLHPLVIRKLLERLQVPNGATPDPCEAEALPVSDKLTDREREILPLLAQGMTNKDIAARLTIAAPTVKTHVSNILRKLGISSRRKALEGLAQHHPQH